MKTFKVSDGKVRIDGVLYGQSPSDVNVMGKMGKIHSVMIQGKGQFFPIGGFFDDGTTPIVLDVPQKKSKLAKTELKETSSASVDESGKLVKVKRSKTK